MANFAEFKLKNYVPCEIPLFSKPINLELFLLKNGGQFSSKQTILLLFLIYMKEKIV